MIVSMCVVTGRIKGRQFIRRWSWLYPFCGALPATNILKVASGYYLIFVVDWIVEGD